MASLDATASGVQQAIDAGYQPAILFVYRDPVDAWYNGVLARAESGGHITPKQVFANAHATARKNLDALVTRFGDKVRVEVFETRNEQAPEQISLEELRAKPQLSKEQILEAIDDGTDRATEEGSGRSGPQGPGVADRGRTQGPREATGEGSTERGDPGQGRATAAPEVVESSNSSPRSEIAGSATAAQREPWEMTASEWHEAMNPAWSMSATHEESKAVVDRMYQFTRAIGEVGGPSAINPLAEKFSPEREADIRQVVIRKAVEHGKSVPRHVLEEYRGRSWADEALAKMDKQAGTRTEKVAAKPPAEEKKGTGTQYQLDEEPTIPVTGTPDPEVAKAIEKVRAKAAEWGVQIDSIDIVDEEHILTWEQDQVAFVRAGITKEQYDDATSHGHQFYSCGTHEPVVRGEGQRRSRITLFRGHHPETVYHEFGHACGIQGKHSIPASGSRPSQIRMSPQE